MENRTKKSAPTFSILALAAGLSGLGVHAGQAKADGTVPGSALVSAASASAEQGQIAVLSSENLYRFQQRPYVRIPEGVTLRVKVPAGVTAADLHNKLTACSKADRSAPQCVEGASVKVTRTGGSYAVAITSSSRAAAIEIQRRASQQ